MLSVRLGRQAINREEAVAEALRNYVRSARSELESGALLFECRVGSFAGLDLCARPVRGAVPVLDGDAFYPAAPYQSGPHLVGALLRVESVAVELSRARELLDSRRKRLGDLQGELNRPFEYEGRLQSLLTRQREIESALELDRNEAGVASHSLGRRTLIMLERWTSRIAPVQSPEIYRAPSPADCCANPYESPATCPN